MNAPGSPRGRAILHMPLLVAALALNACGDAPPDTPPASTQPGAADNAVPDVRTMAFAPETGVQFDAMTEVEDGVWVQDVREGRGTAAEAGSAVSVEYSAWLPDGTLFEQRPSPDGFGLSEFVLCEDPPVDGLNAGMAGMRPGGIRRVVLAPERGYGLVGRPAGVPPNSALVFEVRLLSVR